MRRRASHGRGLPWSPFSRRRPPPPMEEDDVVVDATPNAARRRTPRLTTPGERNAVANRAIIAVVAMSNLILCDVEVQVPVPVQFRKSSNSSAVLLSMDVT
mmetsp:Transcript_49762/g.105819  ORF Transcript_49762/g.105819 Transcript_49762/m.105819 type:complete len:101 (+) Transcript_49762:2419-2721(+)